MNWDAIGAIAELLGAIGVIATLWYLATQIQQNTSTVRASAFQAFFSSVTGGLDILATDTEISRIWYKGLEGLAQLNEDETRRFGSICLTFMRRIEQAHIMQQRGLLLPEDWAGIKASAFEVMSRPGGKEWFEANAWRLNPIFVEDVRAGFAKQGNEAQD